MEWEGEREGRGGEGEGERELEGYDDISSATPEAASPGVDWIRRASFTHSESVLRRLHEPQIR